MKLQGETAITAKESSRFFFLHKTRVAPESSIGILSGRHLECEEGKCDKGIISKILHKVSALGRGEATLFGSKTYSPHRRSKSQERLSSTFPISPFVPKTNLPASKDSTNGSLLQLYRKPISCESKRHSQPNVFACADIQLKVATGETVSKDKFRQTVDISLDLESAKIDKHSSIACPSKNPEIATSNAVISEKVPSIQIENKNNCNVKNISKPSIEEDLMKNLSCSLNEAVPLTVAPKDFVTKVQVKYFGPPTIDMNESNNFGSSQRNDDAQYSNKTAFEPTTNLSNHQPAISSNPSKANHAFLASPPPHALPSPKVMPPHEPSTLWSHQTSPAKKSSKHPKGTLTIRPASNLNASKLKAEFLKLTEFNDIKNGEFAAPVKPLGKRKVADENEEADVLNTVETALDEKNDYSGNEIDKDSDNNEDYEFIGAGVIQGKSMLSKTKSNKRRSVNFSEAPVIHLIEDIHYEADEIPYEVDRGSTTNLLSSTTSATSKGGLSTYKSKALKDFEFDYESLPLTVKSNAGLSTCREEASSHVEENILWSSNNTIDLLF